MNGWLGGVNPSWNKLCVPLTILILPPPPPTLSHDWCTVRIIPPFSGHHGWPTWTEFWTGILQNPESLSHGPVIGIVWYSLIIIFISNSSLLHHPLRKSKLTLILGCHCARFWLVPWLLRIVFQLSFERLWLLGDRYSLLPDYHQNHLILVDLAVPLGLFPFPVKMTDLTNVCVHFVSLYC
jgi:hypothetical protein